jgi:small subunit ribosomal protein S6
MSQALPGYETTFITKNEMPNAALKTLKEKLIGIVGQFGGEIVINEDWGKKKLAYPIHRETRGQYGYLVYTGKGGVVSEMERNLRLNESTIRFLTVNLEKEFNQEEFMKKVAEMAAKRAEAARERAERDKERERERGGDYREHRGDRDS